MASSISKKSASVPTVKKHKVRYEVFSMGRAKRRKTSAVPRGKIVSVQEVKSIRIAAAESSEKVRAMHSYDFGGIEIVK